MSNNPSHGQVPDPRLEQITQRLRELEAQNQQLRGQIDYMAKASQPGQPKPAKQSKFAPDVQAAIDEAVQEKLEPIVENFRNQLGFTHDQLDYLAFNQQYNKPQYEPYLEKIEAVRREAQSKGQWLPREQALQFVYFQETGKKPAPQNTQQATQTQDKPVFDAFLGQYVNAKGEVVDPPGVVNADQLMQQAQQGAPLTPPTQQQTPAPQQFGQQPPQQNWQQQPMQNTWVPQQQPQAAQGFQLPPSTPPEQMPMTPPTGQHLSVDIASSDQALAQWEQKYGDVPL